MAHHVSISNRQLLILMVAIARGGCLVTKTRKRVNPKRSTLTLTEANDITECSAKPFYQSNMTSAIIKPFD